MAEEKRRYVRRLPVLGEKGAKPNSLNRVGDPLGNLPPLRERPEPGARRPSAPITADTEETIARVRADFAETGDDPDKRLTTTASDLVDSYNAGTLHLTHPHYDTVHIMDTPSQRVSESDKNYNKRLGTTPGGAIWARALSLPGSVMSEHGIHYDKNEFAKHWGAPAEHVKHYVERNPATGVPAVTNDDYARIRQSSVNEKYATYKSEDWQSTYGTGSANVSDSGNSWEDTDGTATGDTD